MGSLRMPKLRRARKEIPVVTSLPSFEEVLGIISSMCVESPDRIKDGKAYILYGRVINATIPKNSPLWKAQPDSFRSPASEFFEDIRNDERVEAIRLFPRNALFLVRIV